MLLKLVKPHKAEAQHNRHF